MNRQEFLYQLAGELMSLPPEERVSALKYYEEYFEDAGPENEARVLAELGSPQGVARTILADYAQREPGQDPFYGGPYGGGSGSAPPVPTPPQRERNPWKVLAIVVLILFFGWPILGAVFGLVFGVLGLVFGGVFGLLGGFIGLLTGGISAVAGGLMTLVAAPAAGLLRIGGGLVLSGLGLLICLGGIWLAVWVLPGFIRWVVWAVRRILGIE